MVTAVLFAAIKQVNPPAPDEETAAKGKTVDDLEKLHYKPLLTDIGGSDAEGDTDSGFEMGPSLRPGA